MDLKEVSDAPNGSNILSPLVQNPLVSALQSVYSSFQDRRTALGLPQPGTVDTISKEVTRDVFLSNLMFSGLRAEFTKDFSISPLFQTAHSLAMGGDGNLPPYSLAALFGSYRVFLQAHVDNDFSLRAVANYRWNPSLVTRSSIQSAPGAAGAGQSMFNLETEYTGADYSANIKTMNPSILDDKFTGILIGSYLQSLTPRLALGLETIWQRPSGEDGPTSATSYAARYKGDDWIGSAQLLPQGSIQGAYWRRLSEKIEAGAEITLQFVGLSGAAANPMMAMKNEGSATLGAKYDFRQSSFRGQIDSKGKVSAYLDKRIAPSVGFTFAAEMDHAKNAAKLGMAVALEAPGSEEFAEAQEKAMMGGATPTEPGAIPV